MKGQDVSAVKNAVHDIARNGSMQYYRWANLIFYKIRNVLMVHASADQM